MDRLRRSARCPRHTGALRPLAPRTLMTNRTALLLAVSVAALGVAAYLLFVRGDPEARLSDDSADAVHFLCTRDGHSFSLTL